MNGNNRRDDQELHSDMRNHEQPGLEDFMRRHEMMIDYKENAFEYTIDPVEMPSISGTPVLIDKDDLIIELLQEILAELKKDK